MSEKDDQLRQRLLPIFKGEAREHISTIAAKLGEIEHAADEMRAPLMEVLFREAHSLKAAARAVAQQEIELLCHAAENIFALVKRGDVALSPALFDSLRAAGDGLEDFLAAIDAPPSPQQRVRAAELAKALNAALDQAKRSSGKAAKEAAAPPVARRALKEHIMQDAPAALVRERAAPAVAPAAGASAMTVDTVRLSVQSLDAMLLHVEEILSEKSASRRLAGELKETVALFAQWKKEWTGLRLAMLEVTKLPRGRAGGDRRAPAPLMQFLERNESQIGLIETKLAEAGKAAAQEAHGIALKVDRLLYDVKQILMLQCGSLLRLFPGMVRRLAREQGKEVELIIRGDELTVDRRILEELHDPLLHLLRNCIDHGIEKPGDRVAAGKPGRASIFLSVTPGEGDKVEFSIADDGAGISAQKLAAATIKLGLLSPERAAAAGEAELLPMIFQSGLSTSSMITELSGRGLGLAIVREKVERLGGSVAVESHAGRGTTFRLVVPLALATYRGITVRVDDRLYVLPTRNAERVLRMKRAEVATVEDRPMIDVGGAPVPLVELRAVLELPPAPDGAGERDKLVAVVVGVGAEHMAFEVDGVEGDQEILVKPLGKSLVRVRNIQGATILASGEIAPILNLHDLIKSARKLAVPAGAKTASKRLAAEARRGAAAGRESGRGAAAKKAILLAEDSITARVLLRNILEGAGYRVNTAVDGMEAWSMLKLESFDLLVSDVEMPRMNGFELTQRIRADKNLADLPVVLVTALESREDLERGVDVGANAYILKGGFEQGRLLEAVRRLV
jgi:two-component system chemotaxis sensor kinase CheA